MRHFAMTGMETVAMISRIFLGEAMRATPPSARICAGTRSSAMTATAPAFSAISACLASVTSMMTPPLSISARPVFRRRLVEFPFFDPLVSDMMPPSLLMNRQHNALAVLTLRTRAAFISLPPLSDDTAVSFAPAGARANPALPHPRLTPWTSLLRRSAAILKRVLGLLARHSLLLLFLGSPSLASECICRLVLSHGPFTVFLPYHFLCPERPLRFHLACLRRLPGGVCIAGSTTNCGRRFWMGGCGPGHGCRPRAISPRAMGFRGRPL